MVGEEEGREEKGRREGALIDTILFPCPRRQDKVSHCRDN